MALKINDEYAPRANAPDADYPTGSIKDRTAPGQTDGTPLTANWGNDMVGFTDALLAAGSVTHSGAPDKAGTSDRLTALQRVAMIEAGRMLGNVASAKIHTPGLAIGATDVVIGFTGNVAGLYRVTGAFTCGADVATDVAAGKMVIMDIIDMSYRLNTTEAKANSADTRLDNIENGFKGYRQEVWVGSSTSVNLTTIGSFWSDGNMRPGHYTMRIKLGQLSSTVSYYMSLYYPIEGNVSVNTRYDGDVAINTDGSNRQAGIAVGTMRIITIDSGGGAGSLIIDKIYWRP